MAWTTITPGLDWSNLTFINELVQGYNERRAAGYLFSVIPDVLAGNDVQSVAFWSGIQIGIEQCLSPLAPIYSYGYLDDLAAISGASSTTALIKTQLYSRASMSPDGFSRAINWDPSVNDWTNINDPMYFAHGPIEAGDIIGPWIFKEIQQALSVLKWTAGSVGPDVANFPDNRYKSLTVNEASCALTLAKHGTDWPGTAWSVGTVGYYTCYRQSIDNGEWIQAQRGCTRMGTARLDITYGPPLVNYDWNTIAIAGPINNFTDLDGLGLVDGGYYIDQSGTSPSPTWEITTATRSCGNKTSNPISLAPAYACPVANSYEGTYLYDPQWIYKHKFTNA